MSLHSYRRPRLVILGPRTGRPAALCGHLTRDACEKSIRPHCRVARLAMMFSKDAN